MPTIKHSKGLKLLLGLLFFLVFVLAIVMTKDFCFSGCLDANLKRALERNTTIVSFSHRAFGDFTPSIHTLEIKYERGLIYLSSKGRKPSLLKDYYLQGIDSDRITCATTKGLELSTVTGVPLSVVVPQVIISEGAEMVELSKILNSELNLYSEVKQAFDQKIIEYKDGDFGKRVCKLVNLEHEPKK